MPETKFLSHRKLPQQFLRRLLMSLLGLSCCGTGAALLLFSRLGVDPGSVFINGLMLKLDLSYGTGAAILNIVILTVVFFIDKRYIHIVSILAIVVIGYVADLVLLLLPLLLGTEPSLLVRAICLVPALLILSIGISIYTRARLGIAALDIVAEILADKLRRPYYKMRHLSDLCFFLAGLALGGIWGVGTLLVVLCIGPLVSFIRPRVDPVARRFLREEPLDKRMATEPT